MGGFHYVLDEEARILFVDDDPILREFAKVNLSSTCVSVTVAADGVEALDILRAEPFDIVVCDLEMPRLDGFGVLQALRTDARHAHLPVLVQTGREDIQAIDRAFASGATAFVVKPINWRLLTYQLRFMLRAAATERELRAACAMSAAAA